MDILYCSIVTASVFGEFVLFSPEECVRAYGLQAIVTVGLFWLYMFGPGIFVIFSTLSAGLMIGLSSPHVDGATCPWQENQQIHVWLNGDTIWGVYLILFLCGLVCIPRFRDDKAADRLFFSCFAGVAVLFTMAIFGKSGEFGLLLPLCTIVLYGAVLTTALLLKYQQVDLVLSERYATESRLGTFFMTSLLLCYFWTCIVGFTEICGQSVLGKFGCSLPVYELVILGGMGCVCVRALVTKLCGNEGESNLLEESSARTALLVQQPEGTTDDEGQPEVV